MNLTKFSSPNVDTPNSKYDFCKFATKYMKTNKENNSKKSEIYYIHPVYTPTTADSRGPWSTWPHVIDTQSRGVAWPTTKSSTARSPAVRSSPSCSPPPHAPAGTLGWLGRSPERPHQQAWQLGADARRQSSRLRWRRDPASTATASTNPSGALRCGSSHCEAAVSSGHVHGGTTAQSF